MGPGGARVDETGAGTRKLGRPEAQGIRGSGELPGGTYRRLFSWCLLSCPRCARHWRSAEGREGPHRHGA